MSPSRRIPGGTSKIVRAIASHVDLPSGRTFRKLDDFAPDPNKVVRDPRYARPSGYRKGVRDTVWDDAIEPSTGRVRDPKTGRFMSKDKKWDMGHREGHEFWKHQQSAERRGIGRDEFLDEHNVPDHYRPELPLSNQSHSVEGPVDLYLGP